MFSTKIIFNERFTWQKVVKQEMRPSTKCKILLVNLINL